VNHTETCVETQKRERAAVDAFYAAHPHACRSCGGWSGRSIAGSFDEPPDLIECADCFAKGICPHCGEALGEGSDEPRCPACGWTSEAHGAPEPSDVCDCFSSDNEGFEGLES
jgi:hypothetical protein